MPTLDDYKQQVDGQLGWGKTPYNLRAADDRRKAPPKARFDGPDYDPKRDDVRLHGQLRDIWRLMSDARWRTLAEIARRTGHPEASVSAQLRHLRKPRFGCHTVDRRRTGNRWEYRVTGGLYESG